MAITAVILALGTAAAPAASTQVRRSSQPRLVVSPSKLPVAQAIAPGDRIQRLAELRLVGQGRLAAVYFKASARKSSALDSDPQRGLQVGIERCSQKWRRRGARYSCPGRRFALLARRPLLGRARLRRLELRARRSAHLRLAITLPANAGNSFQRQTTDATYSFVGVAAGPRRRR
jgi:hypothetical protein